MLYTVLCNWNFKRSLYCEIYLPLNSIQSLVVLDFNYQIYILHIIQKKKFTLIYVVAQSVKIYQRLSFFLSKYSRNNFFFLNKFGCLLDGSRVLQVVNG